MLFVELEFPEALLLLAPAVLVTDAEGLGGATLLLPCDAVAAAAATLSPLCGKILPLGG